MAHCLFDHPADVRILDLRADTLIHIRITPLTLTRTAVDMLAHIFISHSVLRTISKFSYQRPQKVYRSNYLTKQSKIRDTFQILIKQEVEVWRNLPNDSVTFCGRTWNELISARNTEIRLFVVFCHIYTKLFPLSSFYPLCPGSFFSYCKQFS